MPYNQDLAQRIHTLIGSRPGVVEKKMFGGVGFMLNGNLACGVQGEDLIVRISPEQGKLALSRPNTRPFLAPVGGKPMAGWVLVSPAGWENEGDFQAWVEQGCDFAMSLPEK